VVSSISNAQIIKSFYF